MLDSLDINSRIEKIRSDLLSCEKQKDFNSLLCDTFSDYNLFCKTHRFKDDKNNFYIGGMYLLDSDKIYLEFYVHKKFAVIPVKDWSAFKFDVSQTIQHELIHRYQNYIRPVTIVQGISTDYKWSGKPSLNEERDYLRFYDEIDAFAHDIAMEIKFNYRDKNPLDVLRQIDKTRKLWSYSYYRRRFKHYNKNEWETIKRKLIKKVYNWLPTTHVYF